MTNDSQHTPLTRRRIYATAKLVFAAGAIAAGATTLAPAAQASPTNIPAAVFKQNCLSTSVPSTQRVEYKVFRVNSDLHQVCTIYSGNYALQSDANVVVGYFTQTIKPGSDRVSSVAS
jgi:nitrous oxide reductase